MSGHQYVPNPANLFTDEDDIEDELFLRNARRADAAYLPAEDKYGVSKGSSSPYTRPDVLGPATGYDVSGGLAYGGGGGVSVGPGGYVMDAPVYGAGGGYGGGGGGLGPAPSKSMIYGGGGPAGNALYGSPSDEDEIAHQRQTFEQRRRELEESTLLTSQRCLGVLRETEQVGIATAEELHRQREQLEKTKKQLDEINNSLRFSQKHLNSLKSVFGGLKNYLSGRMVAGGGSGGPGGGSGPSSVAGGSMNTSMAGMARQNISSPTPTEESDLYPNPQDFRVADPYWTADQSPIPPPHGQQQQQQQQHHHPHHHHLQQQQQQQQQHLANGGSGGPGFSHQLDQNLDEMRGNLSRLKNLALDLNQEIDSQNDLIDDISDRVEDVDVKIGKQNKDMNRLMRK